MYGKYIAGRKVHGMAKKDEAIENFDDYLDGWFFRRPGMERMLDASSMCRQRRGVQGDIRARGNGRIRRQRQIRRYGRERGARRQRRILEGVHEKLRKPRLFRDEVIDEQERAQVPCQQEHRRYAGMCRGLHVRQKAQDRVRRLALAYSRSGREDGVVVRRVKSSRKCG